MNTTFTNSALSRVNRTPAGPFRLHAVFRPNLNVPAGSIKEAAEGIEKLVKTILDMVNNYG
jgi:hypothetical protein